MNDNPASQPATLSDPPDLPGALAGFRDFHQGATILVCGCGASLNELSRPERFITIGVNDVGRRFDPTYLVVLNPRSQFSGDRFRYVEHSRARAIFTQLDLGAPHPHVVRFRLGRYGGADFSNPAALHYTSNSPYLAVCLAAHLGARRIGLIGVDFTDDHFFAATGRHALTDRLEQIDREYAALGRACRERGITIVNLSRQSRLTAFPKAAIEDLAKPLDDPPGRTPPAGRERRVFFVNYRFLCAGDVFTDGLRHAACDLGVQFQDAYWDDPQLPAKVRAFSPELLFVTHGRRFAQRWKATFRAYPSAVWLLDEPYEVDDTASWSGQFDTVYSNDPGALDRHHNARYLPVAYDPWVHRAAPGPKRYAVGFIGAGSPTRERALLQLLDAGLLSYVVGGPWNDDRLRRARLADNIPPAQTAALYQQTRLVINLFRDRHHFNRRKISGWSLNPRLYEALACGALVVSERRPELETTFPELPTFDQAAELGACVRRLLEDAATCDRLGDDCRRRLVGHSYAHRLATVLALGPPPASAALRSVQRHPAPSANTAIAPAQGAISAGEIPADRLSNDSRAVTASRRRPIEPPPFTAMPRRNLLYHLWPVKGSVWRWNLDQLRQRIDLFNGRRLIAIVHDSQAEAPAAVMQYLDGHGCEFIVEPNSAIGECVTFPRLLREIASQEPNEITFYAHGKGVKYRSNAPRPVLRWAEVQYRASLDDWLRVWEHLQQFAMTGPFKRMGRYSAHQNLADWHYCGTFFWLRHAAAFARDCLTIPQFYGGVEAWPGIHFKDDETGCLVLNTQDQAPYQDRFWRTLGDAALQRWQAGVRSVPPPADLVQPAPLDGLSWPRAEQKPAELAWWIRQLLAADVRRLLTIGPRQGGVEWHTARIFREQGRDIEITSIELQPGPALRQAFQDARERFGQSMRVLEGAAAAATVRRALADRYDAVFIDNEHSYRSVRNDWLLARSLQARLVGFHDIVDSHWHVQNRCCVSRLWGELKAEQRTEERASGEWGGVGVVQLQ